MAQNLAEAFRAEADPVRLAAEGWAEIGEALPKFLQQQAYLALQAGVGAYSVYKSLMYLRGARKSSASRRRTRRARMGYPMKYTPNTTNKFERTCIVTLPYTAKRGFSNASIDSAGTVTAPGMYGPGYGIAFNTTGVTVNGTVGSLAVSLPNMADFTALYDTYKIEYIKLRMVYSNSVATVANTTVALGVYSVMPTISYCVDYDDGSAPGANDLLQRPETKYLQFGVNGSSNNIRTIVIRKPKIDTAVITSAGAAAAGGSLVSQWLDIGASNVNHYGFKMYLDSGLNTAAVGEGQAQGILNIYVTYGISFRGIH